LFSSTKPVTQIQQTNKKTMSTPTPVPSSTSTVAIHSLASLNSFIPVTMLNPSNYSNAMNIINVANVTNAANSTNATNSSIVEFEHGHAGDGDGKNGVEEKEVAELAPEASLT
jgi:hypothetical protein